MARTAAERRAHRKSKEQRRSRGRTGAAGPTQEQAHETRVQWLVEESLYTDDAAEIDRIAADLTVLDPGVDENGLVAGLLIALLRGLWERGWQPADVAHVVRRQTTARGTRLVIAAVAAYARAAGAADRAPEDWLAQLEALGALGGGQPGVVATWRRTEGLPPLEAWREVLRLFHELTGVGELPHLLPPPSRWGAHRRSPATAHSATDARVLGRIRALLAKAESTEFAEEAEALSAKAQELMTRHAVDAAVLDAERGTSVTDQIGSRRVHIDNPYPEGKVRLLDAVGTVNGVRVVWTEALGIVTMVGLRDALDAVELLFTSLLVQANRAMTATGRAGSSRTRSPSFRRSFLIAYASRIGERLAEVRRTVASEAAQTSGRDLVPVLRARDEAVTDAFTAMFPQMYEVEMKAFNAQGWYAGRLAAEDAQLGLSRDELHP